MFCGIFRERKGSTLQTLFCRTSFMGHFHFYTNLKFYWENLIFYLCPNVAIFLKNVFIFKDRTKKNIERTRISMWFGRENDENVVRTRDWCGWPSSPPSIGSVTSRHITFRHITTRLSNISPYNNLPNCSISPNNNLPYNISK